MKKLPDIFLVLAMVALSLLAAGQLPASVDEAAPTALVRVDEDTIQVRLDDGGIRIAVPIEWKTRMLQWARMETNIVDLKGNLIAGKSANVFAFRKHQTYRALLTPAPDLKNLSLYCVEYRLTLADGSML